MTKAEAGQIVFYLNAAFHREALGTDTVAFWVGEIQELKSFEVALATAKNFARQSERFPTLHAFREDYLRRKGRESDGVREIESVTSGPRKLPPEVVAFMHEHGFDRAVKQMPDG